MRVEIHTADKSQPMRIADVINTYQKGDLFCVIVTGGTVYKFPLQHIFRIKEYT